MILSLQHSLYFAVALSMVLPMSLSAQASCGHRPLSTHEAHYCVRGTGTPTVVLASGAGSTAGTWNGLADRLSEFGTVVTFDRAGLGGSSPSPASRNAAQIASELRELLDAAELPGPYVLVGHSVGGWHVLRFVEQFPESVQAVVLVDTPHVDFETARLELLSPNERDERMRLLAEAEVDSRDVVRRERRDTRLGLGRGFDPLPPGVRLVVVAADGQEFGNQRTQTAHRDLWVHLSREWLALAEEGEFVVADGSGHMIHHEQPELLLELIRNLLVQSGSA